MLGLSLVFLYPFIFCPSFLPCHSVQKRISSTHIPPNRKQIMRSINASQCAVCLSLILNVVSSISTIFVVKYFVFGHAGFKFGSVITCIHFVATFFMTIFFMTVGCGTFKQLSILRVLPLSLAFCGAVVFNNMSLLHNSVTVYQMSKIICTPVIVLMEKRKYNQKLSYLTKVSLVIVCAGSLTSVGMDVNLTFSGLVWCVLAIFCGALYTVWGKSKQEDLDATPLQLLLYQTGISSVLLILSLPLFENVSDVSLEAIFNATVFYSVLLSCLCAFGVNFSFFVFVGKTSALTTNVLGYFKTTIILFLGFWMNPGDITFLGVFGAVVSCVGQALYTYSKLATSNTTEKLK